jgi:NAD(P)H-dependent FMN reductase
MLLVSGSLRSSSTITAMLRTAQASTPEGVDAVLYEGLAGLPHFNPTTRPIPALGGGRAALFDPRG